MDDKQLLDAISRMMDEKLAQARQEITAQTAAQIQKTNEEITTELAAQLQAARQEIARDTVTLMDAEFKGKFDLLAEEIQALRDGAAIPGRLEQMQELLDMHHALLRQHTRDIQQLRKAN